MAKTAKKLKVKIAKCSQVINELEAEVNFTIKVAYLKFQEQLKRKSQLHSRLDANESRLATGAADDIFLQPNFDKHTNLFLDFKEFQFRAALQRHGIALVEFDDLKNEDGALRELFDSKIHFPFIGLVKEKSQTSFDGAAVLARPPSLKPNLTQCSPQSLKAVLKKYYNSLLFKIVCQVPGKKTQSERFQLILALVSDSKELAQALELYGLKLSDSDQIENQTTCGVFQEANKAYYSYVLDRAWAGDILQTEVHFWETMGLIFENGHKLRSSFWQANPLQSKRVDFCQKEVEQLQSMLGQFTQLLSSEYVLDCRLRLANLIAIALQSSHMPTYNSTSNAAYSKLEIMRNQIVFGAHHSQMSFLNLRKLQEIAQTNTMVSQSYSRLQTATPSAQQESKTSALFTNMSRTIGSMIKPALVIQQTPTQVFDEEVHIDLDSARQARGLSGEKVPYQKIETPEDELSRVESPHDHSNFVGTLQDDREDTHALLTQGGAQMAHQALTRESQIATSEVIPEAPEQSPSNQSDEKEESKREAASTTTEMPTADDAEKETTPASGRASFKQTRQRKTRTSLTQKLALSNQLKNMIEKHKIQGEQLSQSNLDQ